ncbi:transposase [Streptomyces sp. V4I23]|nr:transposase [Streptomyces sp. V4I23]
MGRDQAAPGLRQEPVGDHVGHHDLPTASVDYGFLGQWINPATGKRHRIWAFVMVLPAPRHMVVCLVAHMDQHAWTEAHAKAFRFSSGVPRRLVPDNLRTGVDKLDLYDPQIKWIFEPFLPR